MPLAHAQLSPYCGGVSAKHPMGAAQSAKTGPAPRPSGKATHGTASRIRLRHVRRYHRRPRRRRLDATPRSSATSSTKAFSPTRSGVDAFGVGEHHRAGFLRVGSRGRARRHRRPHQADHARLGRDRAQLGRPDPGVRAVFDAQCRVERPRRGHAWGAARSPSPFRCSATIFPNTRCCSRKNSICSPRCCGRTP